MTVTVNGRVVPHAGNPFAAAVEEELRKSMAGPSARGARVTYGPPKSAPNVSVSYSSKPPSAPAPRVHVTYGPTPRTKLTRAPRKSAPSKPPSNEPALAALRLVTAGRAPAGWLGTLRRALEGKTSRPAPLRPQPRAQASTDSKKESEMKRETRICPTCHGRGYVNARYPGVACPTCGGRGFVIPAERRQDKAKPPTNTTGLPAAKDKGRNTVSSTTTTTTTAEARRRNPAVARLVDRAVDEGAKRGLKEAKRRAKKAKKRAKRAQRAAEQATALIKAAAYGNRGDVTPEQMLAAVDHPGGDPRAVLAAIATLKRRMANEPDEVKKAELGNLATLLALREQMRGRLR